MPKKAKGPSMARLIDRFPHRGEFKVRSPQRQVFSVSRSYGNSPSLSPPRNGCRATPSRSGIGDRKAHPLPTLPVILQSRVEGRADRMTIVGENSTTPAHDCPLLFDQCAWIVARDGKPGDALVVARLAAFDLPSFFPI